MSQQAASRADQPSSDGRLGLNASIAHQNEKPSAPGLKVLDKNGVTQISPDHADAALGASLLMQALGTADTAFFEGLVLQMANVASQGSNVQERELNFMLSVVKAIEPRDEIESLIAAQMAAVHMATMTFARRLSRVETIPQQESATNAFNKLARTFAVQLEALKRYRSTGEQTIKVQHVTINEGGQAIVGAVEHGGRDAVKKIG